METSLASEQRFSAYAQIGGLLKQRLQKRRAVRRSKEDIRKRAHELWEQHGRPIGRDEEFWLQAESENKEGEANKRGG